MKLAGEKERSFSCNKMKIFEIVHVRISMAIFLPFHCLRRCRNVRRVTKTTSAKMLFYYNSMY